MFVEIINQKATFFLVRKYSCSCLVTAKFILRHIKPDTVKTPVSRKPVDSSAGS